MATRGPKPKPNAIKEQTGSRRVNRNEPKFDLATRARPPRGVLGKEGLRFWRTYKNILEERKVLCTADIPAFLMMCMHYETFIRVSLQIREDGMTVTDSKGVMRKHPLLQVQRDHSKGWREYALEFGMTPSSRTRLKVPEAQMSLAEILFGGLDEPEDFEEDEQ